MCLDPVTAGSLALSAAGQAYNSYEANKSQSAQINARNAATLAELERSRAYQKRSNSEFDATLNAFAPQSQAAALTSQQDSVANAFTANTPKSAEVGSISTTGAPRVVADSANKSVADAFAKTNASSAALGKVAGWDQRAFNNNINLDGSARNLDLISDFAKTSSAVNGIEQRAAYNNAFRPSSGIGDILSFAGSVGAYGGGRGWFNAPASAGMNPWARIVKAPFDMNPYG